MPLVVTLRELHVAEATSITDLLLDERLVAPRRDTAGSDS